MASYDVNKLCELVTVQKLETKFKEFRMQDKNEGKRVAYINCAEVNRIRVYKDVVGKECALYANLKAFRNEIRDNFYSYTMKWSGDGYRLLPNSSFFDFIKKHDSLTHQFNMLADKFCEASNISALQSSAKVALGSLYDDKLFNGNLRECYSVRLIPSLIPSGIKSNLDNTALQYVLSGMLQSQKEFLIDGFKDSFNGESGFVSKLDHLITQLSGLNNGDTKKLFDSVVSNVLEVASNIKRINIFNDAEINNIASKAENLLAGINANKLRNSKKLRENIIAESKNIVLSANNKLADLEGLLS